MNPRYRLLFEFLLLLEPVFATDSLTCTPLSSYESASPNWILDTMAFGVETIAARLGHNVITAPAYRPPQVPVDVEGYSIAPDALKLEQVHVYVRHGEHYTSLLNGRYISCFVR